MLNGLPFYIPLLFILTTLVTFILFIAAVKRKDAGNRTVLVSLILVAWLSLHAILSMLGFYTVTNQTPPRFMILVVPPFLAILLFFVTEKGRKFIDTLSPEILTQLHVVRVFVEVVLLWLYMYKFIPRLMTFEGRNFDLISGITATLVYYFGFVRRKLEAKTMLVWNFVCLFILLFTVANAVLSVPTPLQQFGFDQPTIAVLYFPFVWLPGIVVPLVIFSHLISIRLLIREVKQKNISSSLLIIKQVA